MDGSSYFVINQAINKTKHMTPLKGTDPKLVSGGSPTRGMIREGMGNMPNLGKKKPSIYTTAGTPKQGYQK